ncbi:hypothetical protein RQM59_12535 [Flavobacteriaceae bacterium S356]|uniref:Uncharacterized protein n=1 Tax=Asprobacillus argus TaxID=3076534 RepID=A0ABU3LHM9_9FLAO|nr:hypothetical protein [Flavobacteriaceae bacterium S356]
MDFNQVKNEGKQETKNVLKTIFKYSNILGLIGILVAIVLFVLAEKKKELTLTIDSFISLVDKTTLKGSGISISFDSIAVDNLYKVNLSLVNTGNSAITSKDFVKEMAIEFDPNAVLLKYELNTLPETIELSDRKSEKKIWLKPDLLNPGDRIDISTYYSVNKTSSLPTTTSRIVDGEVLIINKSDEIVKPNKFIIPFSKKIEGILVWIAIIWNSFFFLLITWASFLQKSIQKNGFAANFIAFVFLGIGCILTILYLLQNEFFM